MLPLPPPRSKVTPPESSRVETNEQKRMVELSIQFQNLAEVLKRYEEKSAPTREDERTIRSIKNEMKAVTEEFQRLRSPQVPAQLPFPTLSRIDNPRINITSPSASAVNPTPLPTGNIPKPKTIGRKPRFGESIPRLQETPKPSPKNVLVTPPPPPAESKETLWKKVVRTLSPKSKKSSSQLPTADTSISPESENTITPSSPQQLPATSPSASQPVVTLESVKSRIVSSLPRRSTGGGSPTRKPSTVSRFITSATTSSGALQRIRQENADETISYPRKSGFTDINVDLKFPETKSQNLLPFIVVSKQLINLEDSTREGFPELNPDTVRRINKVDKLIELVMMMSDTRHFFARNMEDTFDATYLGYFVEPAGIAVIDKLMSLPESLDEWSKRFGKIGRDLDQKRMIEIEESMLSIFDLVTEYCHISRGSICTKSGAAKDNRERIEYLKDFSDSITYQKSFLKRPLKNYVEVLLNISATNPNFNDKKIGKTSGTDEEVYTEERILKNLAQMTQLIKPGATTVLLKQTVDSFINSLNQLIVDLTTLSLSVNDRKKQELSIVVDDLKNAIDILIVKRKKEKIKGSWNGATRNFDTEFPNLEKVIIDAFRILYYQISFVISAPIEGGGGDLNLKPAIPLPELTKSLRELPEVKALKSQTQIDVDAMIGALRANLSFPKDLPLFGDVVLALTKVYRGVTQLVSINYVGIADQVNSVDEQTANQFAGAFMNTLVEQLTGSTRNNFGEKLYIALPDIHTNEPPLTQDIIDIIISSEFKVHDDLVIQDLAKIIPPTRENLVKIMLANQTIEGTKEIYTMPNNGDIFQELYIKALDKYDGGPMTTRDPPEWTGIQRRN